MIDPDVNSIANTIIKLRCDEIIKKGPFYEPNIVVYVGNDQYAALMRHIYLFDGGIIGKPELLTPTTFLDASVVRVQANNYVHVTLCN